MTSELAALGLRDLSWRRVKRGIANIAEVFGRHDLLTYSSAIAFQVLYAVVPLSLVALAGLGIVGGTSVYTDHIAPTLHRDLSGDAYAIATRTALRVLGTKRVFWCTIGLVATAWGLGSALRSMMTPLNAVYGAKETRSWLNRIATSILAGFAAVICVGIAIGIGFGGRLLHTTGVAAVLAGIARWVLTLALLLLANAILIRFVPAKARPVRWVSVGSALATICWVVGTLGFAAYISEVSYASFYGALAGIVLLLIYLHVSAIAFLLGVVVDALLRQEVDSSTR